MEQEWSKFVKIYKEAKPFENHGWAHLEKMTEIMPVTLRGTYVFRPSQGVTGMDTAVRLPRPLSPDWDIEDADFGEVPPPDHDEDSEERTEPAPTMEVSLILVILFVYAMIWIGFINLESSHHPSSCCSANSQA
jgi:hypothetical protein